MDVTSWFLRRTEPRPLLVTAPGGTGARLAVEKLVRVRGWRMATSPAHANTLIMAGADHRIESHVERLWQSMPAPRVRVDVATAVDADRELAAVTALLHDTVRQRAEAARPEPVPVEDTHSHHMTPDDHQAHGDSTDHATHDGHGGHGGHMSGMELPGGVPMADRAPDRDGLTLDQLTLPLGPALALWPAGLVVHTQVQGDVIRQVSVELLTGDHVSFWAPRQEHHVVARCLDSCHRLLAVAGWEDAAVTAQRLRDDALAGESPDVRRWAGRVRRSRTLRWLLSGVGTTPERSGDALDRLHWWLDLATTPSADLQETQWTVDDLPALLSGTELAGARLIVASIDPDLDVPAAHGVRHG